MPRLVFFLLVGMTFSTAFSAARAAGEEDARLTAFFKEYLEQLFRARPFDATGLGDHRFDHLLDDLTPAARAGWTQLARQTLADLPKRVAYDRLSRDGQVDFEILKHQLTRDIWLAENTRPYETDPRVYNTYISDSIYLLLTQSTLPRAVNIKNAAARMAEIPKVVAAARANLKDPPRVIVETAIRQNRGAIAFYEKNLFEVAGENANTSPLAPPAKALVPLLREYGKFLEEDVLPRANGDWRLGKEKFYRKLELELDAGLGAQEVLREAEAEFERVQRDMYVIARQLWSRTLPGKPLPADDTEGRRQTVSEVLRALGRDHGTPASLLADTQATVDRVRRFIRERDLLRLPDPDRCAVIEMPEFQRGNSTAYLNPAPPLDPRADSVYAVSPPPRDWDARRVASYFEEYNKHMLQILTIHEAYPGHYVQLEYSNRHPSFVRRVLSSGVFAEGWAVYTEQVMLDEGYGDGDLALRLHQLKFYLRAVTNAILDHHMHCGNMTDEQALALMVGKAYQSEGEALGKVVRAKQSSCQLSTYFVGRMAFYRLRQAVQREQGEKFDLGRYHEAVLAHGTLPVKYLPEVVRTRLKAPR